METGAGRLPVARRDLFDHLISAERAAFAGEDFEDEPAARRQYEAMCGKVRLAEIARSVDLWRAVVLSAVLRNTYAVVGIGVGDTR